MGINAKKIISFVHDALEGLWFNRNVVISSVVIVISSLCLFGAYISFSSNINYISEQFKSQYKIRAYLEKGTPEERVKEIKEELGDISHIADIGFVSEDDALEECIEMFGDDYDFLNGLEEDNPLRASFEVTLTNLEKANAVTDEISKIIDVSWVKNNQELVTEILDITSAFKRSTFVLMVIFAVISIFIVANTIKISVAARKDDIFTMRYVGATNDYIVCPFVIEGIIIGLIGALAGYIVVMIGYSYCAGVMIDYIDSIAKIYRPHEVALKLLVAFIVLGLFIGTSGSVYSVKRYIKV